MSRAPRWRWCEAWRELSPAIGRSSFARCTGAIGNTLSYSPPWITRFALSMAVPSRQRPHTPSTPKLGHRGNETASTPMLVAPGLARASVRPRLWERCFGGAGHEPEQQQRQRADGVSCPERVAKEGRDVDGQREEGQQGAHADQPLPRERSIQHGNRGP